MGESVAKDQGYYRQPTIRGDQVVFVSEDDLWTVSTAGGTARRLTANPGRASYPALSPDGRWLAYTGRDEGASEVWLMPAQGGQARRLTHLGGNTSVVGFTPDVSAVLCVSDARQPLPRMPRLHRVPLGGGEPEALPYGPVTSISFGPGGGKVIGRHTGDIAGWKRYRGGLTGDLWIDERGAGEWRRLVTLPGNLARPLWLAGRIYFVADHEGTGNLYSCTPGGEELRRHTNHAEFFVRHPATDGKRIVYAAGADLYLFDPESGADTKLEFDYHSSRAERGRRFVAAAERLQEYRPAPRGGRLALTSRGRTFVLDDWRGAAIPLGAERTRTRFATWLPGGERLVTVSDDGAEERLELHTVPGEGGAGIASSELLDLAGVDLGRPRALVGNPVREVVALANQRFELLLVDVRERTARLVDRSEHGGIQGMAFSPDGRWLAYGFRDSPRTSVLRLYRLDDGTVATITRRVLRDGAPAFDPDGRYLYFLSEREFEPVYDALRFDLGFPRGARPYLVALRQDASWPFGTEAGAGEAGTDEAGAGEDAGSAGAGPVAPPGATPAARGPGSTDGAGKAPPEVVIDLGGIEERAVALPVPAGRYGRVAGLGGGRVVFTSYPIENALELDWSGQGDPPADGKLELFELGPARTTTLVEGVTDFDLSADAGRLYYRAGNRLRTLKAGEKPPEDARDEPGRESGWLDLDRVRVEIEPPAEWRQMVREAWRLQRDHFWTEDMSGVDWEGVYRRYLPLLERVGTRAELTDLLAEMQGELGTSHAYVIGGDYRPEPEAPQGFLGAEFRLAEDGEGYVITAVVAGDPWDERRSSPLARAGSRARVGDTLLAINGRRLTAELAPAALLVDQGGREVLLTVAPAGGGEALSFTVKTLTDERPARYRDWVEAKRAATHRLTGGRVGYLHIPDMGPEGFAEFYRGYLLEAGREGLIVDVRGNGGGHVSELLLETLARKRLGFIVPRWGRPEPYPELARSGPVVAVTDQYAGSDGDIFSHAFKMLGLGPLVGQRTWGGVVGIDAHGGLLDGGLATQPEYAFWFEDVGWRVENYGTDPTVPVEYTPSDYEAGRDPQLERAAAEALRLLGEAPPAPEFGERPRLAPPQLEPADR